MEAKNFQMLAMMAGVLENRLALFNITKTKPLGLFLTYPGKCEDRVMAGILEEKGLMWCVWPLAGRAKSYVFMRPLPSVKGQWLASQYPKGS